MKTFQQFILEADLDSLAADIASKAKREKPAVNKPDFGSSQSEPKAPTNVAPVVASAANRATGGYAGHVANTAMNTVSTATKQVVRGALGQNRKFQEQLSTTTPKNANPNKWKDAEGNIYTRTPQGTIKHSPKKDPYVPFTNEPGKPATGLW